MRTAWLAAAFGALSASAPAGDIWGDFRAEDYEEPAGAMAFLETNPVKAIYGLGAGNGLWLRGTPVMAEYFLSVFYNDLERALYGGLGMTVRLMSRRTAAPFVGAGGSYNFTLFAENDEAGGFSFDDPDRGEPYLAGHLEAGIRFSRQERFWELALRQTFSSSPIAEPNYLLLRFGIGLRL